MAFNLHYATDQANLLSKQIILLLSVRLSLLIQEDYYEN